MSNILDVAKNRDEYMAAQDIRCPLCGEKQFSSFDKLFTLAYTECVDCTSAEELEQRGNVIFQIIEA